MGCPECKHKLQVRISADDVSYSVKLSDDASYSVKLLSF